MRILQTIKDRRSIREFERRDIPPEALDCLVEALRWAPSAGNLQSRKFYFITNGVLRRELAGAVGNPDLASRMKRLVKTALGRNFVAKAPLVVVACLDRNISESYGERGVSLYAVQDVAASVMNMLLVAHDLGLGSCWIGGFDEKAVSEIVDLPVNLRPVVLVPLGYPASVPRPTARVTKEEAVQFVF